MFFFCFNNSMQWTLSLRNNTVSFYCGFFVCGHITLKYKWMSLCAMCVLRKRWDVNMTSKSKMHFVYCVIHCLLCGTEGPCTNHMVLFMIWLTFEYQAKVNKWRRKGYNDFLMWLFIEYEHQWKHFKKVMQHRREYNSIAFKLYVMNNTSANWQLNLHVCGWSICFCQMKKKKKT